MSSVLASTIPFLIAQNIKLTNWLTPVWIVSVGIGLGFILALVMLLKIVVFQKVPGINSVTEKPALRYLLGFLTSLLYLGFFLGFWYWRFGADQFTQEFVFPLCFVVPLCFLLGFGVWNLCARRMIGETGSLFNEGFLGWVNKVCVAMLLFAIIGFGLGVSGGFGVVKFVDDPMAFVDSLKRLPFTKPSKMTVEIPPAKQGDQGTAVPVGFIGNELQRISFQTDQKLEIMPTPILDTTDPGYILEIPVREEGDPYVYRQRADGRGKIPLTEISELYVRNVNRKSPATVELAWELAPVYKEVSIIPVIALIVFGMYAYYMILATMCPKVFAIAHSTFKTEVNQPLYLLVLVIGALFMVGSIYVPYNTFGEDIKMYKDSGLTLIRVLAIFLAIWAASKSVAAEIEGRTALTVLSKPVGRRQFIFGKFTGISLAIGLMFIVLGLWFFAWVSYKPIYDFAEASKGLCEWPECFLESTHIAPGIFLCFLEVLIFVAISVAISTRMGVLANFLICFSIYVLGHLTPLLVQSSMAEFQPIVVFGQLIAIVFPVLNHYDVQAAINTNSPVPLDYIGWSIIYTAIYGTVAMLLALVLFEDRDLA